MATAEGVHFAHCNQGEYVGSCKYGNPDCQALDVHVPIIPKPGDMVTIRSKPVGDQPINGVHVEDGRGLRAFFASELVQRTLEDGRLLIRTKVVSYGGHVDDEEGWYGDDWYVDDGDDGWALVPRSLMVADSDPIYGPNADQPTSGRPTGVSAADWNIYKMLKKRCEDMSVPIHPVPGAFGHQHVVVLSVLEMDWLLRQVAEMMGVE